MDVIVLAIRGYSGVRRLVEWSKGFIQTHTEDESELAFRWLLPRSPLGGSG